MPKISAKAIRCIRLINIIHPGDKPDRGKHNRAHEISIRKFHNPKIADELRQVAQLLPERFRYTQKISIGLFPHPPKKLHLLVVLALRTYL